MYDQETRELGAMVVQQGYTLSFMMLYGHWRQDRANEKSCWIYEQLPIHPFSLLFENG